MSIDSVVVGTERCTVAFQWANARTGFIGKPVVEYPVVLIPAPDC